VKPHGVGASPTLAANLNAECRLKNAEWGQSDAEMQLGSALDDSAICILHSAIKYGRQADISWLHLSRKQGPRKRRSKRYRRLPPISFAHFKSKYSGEPMTLTQYLPQWLRRRPQITARPRTTTITKKDRQILPTLPQNARPPARLQDDD